MKIPEADTPENTNPNDTDGHRFFEKPKITPYTDLLLHDMGPGLTDNVPDHLASGSEWGTQPLWD